MEIHYFDRIDSTQRYAVAALKAKRLKPPFCIFATYQNDGIGSKGRSWEGERGNFFASFAMPLAALPNDLPPVSASIYFMMLMKETLSELGEGGLWVKWPNDIYKEDKKVAGCITTLIQDVMVCGIGVNLKQTKRFSGSLASVKDPQKVLKHHLRKLQEMPSWTEIFKQFEIEFSNNSGVVIQEGEMLFDLTNATLQKDGTIMIDGKVVVGAR